MPPARLAEEITKERGDVLNELFGVNLRSKQYSDSTQPPGDYRFPNDLSAFKMFVGAALALQNSGNPMAGLEHVVPGCISRGRSSQHRQEMKTRKITHRAGENAYLSRCMDDFVDVGLRLDRLPDDQLELLVNYYVLGQSADKLSRRYQIEPCQLGGRISQARKALRQVLGGLIPSRESIEKPGEGGPSRSIRAVDRRRDKVSRFLSKRIR
jgi:hypothetical protein